MPAKRRPLLIMLAVAAVVLALTSCSNDDGVDQTEGATTARATPRPACVDGVVQVGTGDDLELHDDCSFVRVSGTDSTVDLTDIDVDRVEINGDRNHITADTVPDAVRISGQENEIEGVELGAVDIHGDRNTVTADEKIAAITVHGNDNDVAADEYGKVTDNGDRNVVPGAR